ncbi:MAG: homoserine dehydrogenase [Cyclobacteriaceae bacterium]|nr:MAG: homoserine dehydrogenase [Cyclobacteriaceae bacterium]
MSNKPLTIGLFGFGCVGQGLWKIAEQRSDIQIKKICVKSRHKPRPLPESYFTYNPDDILSDPETDVVVELIDDAGAALQILKNALQKGKHVVTANKRMLAENLIEVLRLQRQHNRAVLYEAAVCGSIPIIRTLEEYYAHQEITAIDGIFNGSTNYILTRVLDENRTYAEALHEAQKAGFAEADPTLDVEGLDPRYKLSLAILHAFGMVLLPEQIPVAGISKIGKEEVRFARQNGLSLKLSVGAVKEGNRIFAYVLPQFVPVAGALAAVRHEFNAVHITGSYTGKQLLVGKGAGSLPTALAVLSDIAALHHNYRYAYTKYANAASLEFTTDVSVKAWVRFSDGSGNHWQAFTKIIGGAANASGQVVVGELPLDKLMALQEQNRVTAVLIADDCTISTLPADATGVMQQVA